MKRATVTLRVYCDEPGCGAWIEDTCHGTFFNLEQLERLGWHMGPSGACDFCPAHNVHRSPRSVAGLTGDEVCP